MKKLGSLIFSFATWGLIICSLILYLTPLVIWIIQLIFRSWRESAMGVFGLYLALIPRTLAISFVAAMFAVLLGSVIACVAVASSKTVSNCLTVIMTVPLLIGFIARNYAWVGLLSQLQGETRILFLGYTSRLLLYKPFGVVFVMTTVFIPFCYFCVLRELTTLHIETLQAARTMGATDATIFWRIILPSIRACSH